jgi:integrase
MLWEPSMKFTRADIVALKMPPGKTDHIEWDDSLPGFGIRLRGESKTFVVQYRVGRQTRRESLGDVRKINLDDARKIARQRFASVELGIDPSAERAKARAAATALAFGNVADRYLAAKRHRMTERTHRAATRYFATYWHTLHNRPLDAIRRADIAARLQELIDEHGRAAATRARSNLSALFAWAMAEGLCEANPVNGTNNPGAGVQARDRILTDQELAAIWAGCLDEDFGRILKLLILLGCRRDEIGVMTWNEIDLDTGVLTIPGARTKNKRTLRLPLPTMALDLLRAQPKREGREYVFGPRGMGFSGWSFATVALHKRLAAAKIAPWRIHDLRRTMRSGLGRLSVPPHIAELAIGHARRGVEATYDRYSYEAEIGVALARWADHVRGVIEGRPSTIVPLRA